MGNDLASVHPVTYEQLIAYAAGELSSDESADVTLHVKYCADCTATVNRYQTVAAVLRTGTIVEPPRATLARAQKIFAPKPKIRQSLLRPIDLSPFVPGRRLAATLALLTALLLGTLFFGPVGAIAAATQDSIPGDALYPVKIAAENAQLVFTLDTVNKADLHLSLAEERVKEIESLNAKREYEAITSTAQAYVDQITQADRLLSLAKKRNVAVTASAKQMERVLTRAMNVFTALLETTPNEIKPAITRAINASDAGKLDARQVQNETTPVPPLNAEPTITPAPTPSPTRKPEPSITPPGQATPSELQDNRVRGRPITPPGKPASPPGQGNKSPSQQNQPPGQQNQSSGQQNVPPGQQNQPHDQQNQPASQQNQPPGQLNQPSGPKH